MLDNLLFTADQAGRPVLQIGQAVLVGLIHTKPLGVIAVENRIVAPDQDTCRRGKCDNFRLGGALCPQAQRGQRRLGLGHAGTIAQIDLMNVHDNVPNPSAADRQYRAQIAVPQALREGIRQIGDIRSSRDQLFDRRACVNSSIRSPTSSNPTDRRIRPGVMPNRSF